MSRPMMQRLAIVVAAGLLASCTAMQPGGAIGWTLPPTNGQFDYQLGGAYEPAEGVVVVVRDSTAAPAFGLPPAQHRVPADGTPTTTEELDLDESGEPPDKAAEATGAVL